MSYSVPDFIREIKQKNHRSLAKVITLLESRHPDKRQIAQDILQKLNNQHVSRKIAFTGPPGAGKSSLIETLGLRLAESGSTLAVLTIDPSSPISGGSVLADKTRMQKLSNNPNAFIRPSASGKGYLGGTNAATVDVINLIEAAGYDYILVETIGIGQNEVDIKDLVDKVILVLPPASGDEFQGLKKGVNEIVDLIVVNKHDGDLKKSAELTALHYESALNFSKKKIPVQLCSASEGSGINNIIELLKSYEISPEKRQQQSLNLFEKIVLEELILEIINSPSYNEIIQAEKNALKNKERALRPSVEKVLLNLKKF